MTEVQPPQPKNTYPNLIYAVKDKSTGIVTLHRDDSTKSVSTETHEIFVYTPMQNPNELSVDDSEVRRIVSQLRQSQHACKKWEESYKELADELVKKINK